MARSLRLLIIEDVEDHALLVARELNKGGFETTFRRVDTVEGLRAALEPASEVPDAIISDFTLPGFNALDALRLVQEKGVDVPFIIVSGVMGEETAVEAMKAGAHDFILKGRYSRLVPALERELHEAVLRRERSAALAGLLEAHEQLERHNVQLREINEQLKMETARRLQAVEELRRRDQMLIQQCRMSAVGEMLDNIAHHWRQPLNVLGLNVQEIGLSCELGCLSKDMLDAKVADAMAIILQLSRSLDQFRMFSAPEKEPAVFSVEEAIATTVSVVGEGFNERGISVDVSVADDPRINGYLNEYRQVLMNILNNARDAFAQEQPQRPTVSVRAWREDGKAVVTITDNAGGIDEDILEKIFDAYYTTKRQGKGSGVGLFLAKKMIETDMGGSLTARNVPGGAEFRIEV